MGRSYNNTIISRSITNNSPLDLVYESMAAESERIVYLSGDVNEHSISSVITTLLSLANQDSKTPINLIVSTYGGSVDEMFSLYDVMKFLPCPVHTVGLGKIMSAGVLLMSAGKKGKRSIGKNTRVMIHPISSGNFGSVIEMINEVDELKRMQTQMFDALLKETKLSKDKLNTIMGKGHDFYLNSKQAIEFGIADKIIGEK